MRISGWSSDVCSSDLDGGPARGLRTPVDAGAHPRPLVLCPLVLCPFMLHAGFVSGTDVRAAYSYAGSVLNARRPLPVLRYGSPGPGARPGLSGSGTTRAGSAAQVPAPAVEMEMVAVRGVVVDRQSTRLNSSH